MPRYARPQPHIQYRNNIMRKGSLETTLLWESEALPKMDHQDWEPEGLKVKSMQPTSNIGSPVSVQDVYLPEMKQLSLPGSWTVVGKKGKPLKGKMYEEPHAKKKARNARKKKARKPKDEVVAEPLADLVETPSSSACLRMNDRSNAKHSREVARARDAKYWARYQDSKDIAKDVLAAQIAIMSVAEHARARAPGGDEGRLERRVEKMREQMVTAALDKMTAQEKARRKSSKGSSHKQAARRAARSLSRCYALEDNEYEDVLINPTARQMKMMQAVDVDVHDVFGPFFGAASTKNGSSKVDERKTPDAASKSSDADQANSKAAKKGSKKKKSCSIM